VEQGAHPKEMAELMGHSSVQITLDRYSHVMPRLTTALAKRMDAAYRAAEPDPIMAVRPATSLDIRGKGQDRSCGQDDRRG